MDVFPSFQQSSVVYEYVCHSDSQYVGRTSQLCRTESASMCGRLFGTKQPGRQNKLPNSIPHCDSAIGNFFFYAQPIMCISHYKGNQFFILSKTRSDFIFQSYNRFL